MEPTGTPRSTSQNHILNYAQKRPSAAAQLHRRDTSVSAATKKLKAYTPRDYVDRIQYHARQSPDITLYPGPNYIRLATYLSRPYDNAGAAAYQPTAGFAAYYTLNADDKLEFTEPDHPNVFASGRPGDESGRPQIVFLRGQPSSEWLSSIGSAYCVDPEFFLGHLDFWSSNGGIDYFTETPLVAGNHNMLQLSYVTLGRFPEDSGDLSPQSLSSQRAQIERTMSDYTHKLSKTMESDANPGDSIVRRYSMLDKDHYAIEQWISIHCSWTAKTWSLVIWIDTGNPLRRTAQAPWTPTFGSERTALLPTIQYRPSIALKHRTVPNERQLTNVFEQSASLLRLDYGSTLNKRAMAADPVYALTELFRFCTFSYSQFLTAIDTKLNKETMAQSRTNAVPNPANLIFYLELLDRHMEVLKRNSKAIKAFGREIGAVCRPVEVAESAAEKGAESVADKGAESAAIAKAIAVYEELEIRTSTLSKRCQGRIQVLMNAALIQESNKAMNQAREVTKLTRLAFVFIPLSFIASFFGMNLSPLVSNAAYGLKTWFSIAVPIVVASVLVMQLSLVQLIGDWLNKKSDRAIST